jgi:hypothetical protein
MQNDALTIVNRLLISSWYKPSEIAVRVALVYCGNTIANGFGGLIAAGILSGLDGKGGLAGWRSANLSVRNGISSMAWLTAMLTV